MVVAEDGEVGSEDGAEGEDAGNECDDDDVVGTGATDDEVSGEIEVEGD